MWNSKAHKFRTFTTALRVVLTLLVKWLEILLDSILFCFSHLLPWVVHNLRSSYHHSSLSRAVYPLFCFHCTYHVCCLFVDHFFCLESRCLVFPVNKRGRRIITIKIRKKKQIVTILKKKIWEKIVYFSLFPCRSRMTWFWWQQKQENRKESYLHHCWFD